MKERKPFPCAFVPSKSFLSLRCKTFFLLPLYMYVNQDYFNNCKIFTCILSQTPIVYIFDISFTWHIFIDTTCIWYKLETLNVFPSSQSTYNLVHSNIVG